MTIGRPRIFSSHPAGVTAHIEPEDFIKLGALARSRGVSKAVLFREAIHMLLDRDRETVMAVLDEENAGL
jgi:hypothetical protein